VKGREFVGKGEWFQPTPLVNKNLVVGTPFFSVDLCAVTDCSA
jgi:hypothetical protein